MDTFFATSTEARVRPSNHVNKGKRAAFAYSLALDYPTADQKMLSSLFAKRRATLIEKKAGSCGSCMEVVSDVGMGGSIRYF